MIVHPIFLPTLQQVGMLRRKKKFPPDQFLLLHYFRKKTDLHKDETLFVELCEGMYIPFGVDDCAAIDESTSSVRLLEGEDMNDERYASLEKKAYMERKNLLPYCAEDSFLLAEEFSVFVREKYAGIAKDNVELKQGASLLVVEDEGKQFHLPFHKELILSRDEAKKILVLNLPEDSLIKE